MKIQCVEGIVRPLFTSHTKEEVQEALETGLDVWMFERSGGGYDDIWILPEGEARHLAEESAQGSQYHLTQLELLPLPEITLGAIWEEWCLDPITDWGFPQCHTLTEDTPARFSWHHDSYVLEYHQDGMWHALDGLRASLADVWGLVSLLRFAPSPLPPHP